MEKIIDFPDAEICIALLCGIANGEEVKAKLIDGSLSATLLNCRHVCRNNNLSSSYPVTGPVFILL